MQRVRKQLEVPSICNIAEGRNVTVAVLDTGIGCHPDLSGKMLGFKDFVHHRPVMYDDNGHGTHICGIICGSGELSEGVYAGIAPDARLVVGKVLDRNGDGSVEHMLAGLRWILSVREKYNIRILNVSVGIGMLDSPEKENALQKQLEALWDSGILVVCAAGNKGPVNGSISAFGSNVKVLTVGCHDGNFYTENPKRCETYSGRGNAMSSVRKPDLVAPGTDIFSCNIRFGKIQGRVTDAYIAKSGTSMATPIVAGAAALALQKFPGLTNEELKQRLTLTAIDLREPWNKQGWGMVNVRRLLQE